MEGAGPFEIVARVAWCMGEFGHADAVPQLVKLATDHDDAVVRRQSVAALRRLADERGLQASIDALDDADPEVRTQAAAALGALGSQRAVGALIGFSALLAGGFSRFGLWRQVNLAIAVLIAIQLIDNGVADRVLADERLIPLVYVPDILGLVAAAVLLKWSGRTRRAPRGVPA